MNKSLLLATLAVLGAACSVNAQDASIGRTPPMGWNSWNVYRCDIDAGKIKAAADALVSTGLRDAGYVYLNIDDCWQLPQRDKDGSLQADPKRFPGGIKEIADYAHARGLKLGIYANPGSRTCANIYDNYPGRNGSLGHEAQDAKTFAAWGVDYLKYDWCLANEDGLTGEAAFSKMRDALRATGRPIFYSIHHEPQLPMDSWRPQVANAWRTTPDIRPTWPILMRNLDAQVGLEKYSRPGAWNDPDMLEVGNGTLSLDENRAHFSLWALLNSPLLLGNDLGAMTKPVLEIIENEAVIAVNQDWAGTQGHKLRDDGDSEVWGKPMSDGSFAVVLLNRAETPAKISVDAAEMKFPADATLQAKDLWSGKSNQVTGRISADVPSHGVAMYRVRVGKKP